MTKNLKYSDLNRKEAQIAYASMIAELVYLPKKHAIRSIFEQAWNDYTQDKFSFDGATFVKERNPNSIFEVAALVHDWRNSAGCVGKQADREMFDIMIRLSYRLPLIIERWLFCRLTFINVLRHKCLKTYRRELPTNFYVLSNQ